MGEAPACWIFKHSIRLDPVEQTIPSSSDYGSRLGDFIILKQTYLCQHLQAPYQMLDLPLSAIVIWKLSPHQYSVTAVIIMTKRGIIGNGYFMSSQVNLSFRTDMMNQTTTSYLNHIIPGFLSFQLHLNIDHSNEEIFSEASDLPDHAKRENATALSGI